MLLISRTVGCRLARADPNLRVFAVQFCRYKESTAMLPTGEDYVGVADHPRRRIGFACYCRTKPFVKRDIVAYIVRLTLRNVRTGAVITTRTFPGGRKFT